jgi:uncharacterized protein YkwD
VVHADLALAGGTNRTRAFYMTIPSARESAWMAGETSDRAAFGVAPAPFDEAALEAARYWSGFMQRNAYFAHCIPASACTPGDTTRAPATYGPQDVDPNHRFRYERGFSGALEAENIAAGFPSWQSVESAFMPERESCPNGSAATCPFSDATGHFLNIVDADYAWSAGAIVAPAASAAYDDQEFTAIGSATAGTNGFARGRFVAGSSSHE